MSEFSVDVDLQQFWEENRASSGKPFSTDKPRIPVSLPVDDHWVIEEMGVPSTVRFYQDAGYRAQVNRECNDRCEPMIGIRPFQELAIQHNPRRIEEVFGAQTLLTEGGTPWLETSFREIGDLRRRLDEVEDLDLEAWCLTPGFLEERERLREAHGHNPHLGGGSRGPATIATSVMGTERLFYWIADYPEDMERFFRLLAEKLIEHSRMLRRLTGGSDRHYGWADDNCALFSPPLYERFCLPVLERVFGEFCPDPQDYRFQHSDSSMAHLLGLLARCRLSGCNFGPDVPAAVIRAAMPRTEILGCLPPMLLRDGSAREIREAVQRDIDAVGADGGLLLMTAGSIAAGTSLERIRYFMAVASELGRY